MTEVALDNQHLLALVISGVIAAIVVALLLIRNGKSGATFDRNARGLYGKLNGALSKVLQHLGLLAHENPAAGADVQALTHSDTQQKELVEKLVVFMEQNKPYLESHITVERLANKLNVSPKLLSSTINNQLHVNFFELIGNYRVAEAKKRLADSGLREKPISEIMKSCGFNSKSVFNQAFKKSVGVTPSHYRQQHLH